MEGSDTISKDISDNIMIFWSQLIIFIKLIKNLVIGWERGLRRGIRGNWVGVRLGVGTSFISLTTFISRPLLYIYVCTRFGPEVTHFFFGGDLPRPKKKR